MLADSNLIERLGELLQNAEQAASELNLRTRRMARLYLGPDADEPDGRKPDENDVAKLTEKIDPRPAYWARLERHFFVLLGSLPEDWDNLKDNWKPVERQAATNAWREHVKGEARRALEESIRSLGTTSRVIQAVARVRAEFSDYDLSPPQRKAAKTKRSTRGSKKR
jgi:CRISPR system Cascade subunit CasA